MNSLQSVRFGLRCVIAGVGFAAVWYATYVALASLRYGQMAHSTHGDREDLLLDRFLPKYEVGERHHVHAAAPAEITFSTACAMNLEQSLLIRAIFKARELVVGGKPEKKPHLRGLVAQAKAWGWGGLAEDPGRQLVT